MSQEWELRQKIVAAPGEDEPRLAYADWCESQGNSGRAEFIRLQVGRGRVDPRSAEAERLFALEMAVIRTKWKGSTTAGEEVEATYKKRAGITTPVFGLTVERGFVSAVSGRVADFVQTGAEICAVEPVESLGLYWEGGNGIRETKGDIERLAAMPILARMKNLTISPDLELLRALSNSEFVGVVEGLMLVEPGRRLAAWSGSQALVQGLTAGLQASFIGVKRLKIRDVEIGLEGVEQLCACPAASRLERLELEGIGMGDAGAKVIAAADQLSAVTELWLRNNGLTNASAKILADSPVLASVTDLDLGKNKFDEVGMKSILERKGMPALARLGLEEVVHEQVYEEWTDWNGGNVGGGYAARPMRVKAVAERFAVEDLELYENR